MLVGFILMAISIQGIFANPLPKEPTTAEILDYINTKSPLVWETFVDTSGVSGNRTTYDTALWDEAVSAISSDTAVGKRALVKRGMHCYGSGLWAKQFQMRLSIGDVCRFFDHLAHGASATVSYPTRDRPTIDYHKVNRFGGNSGCEQAINKIIDVCHGDAQDSQGGMIWDEFDNNEYWADPN